MNQTKVPLNFDVCLYGKIEELTPTLSKCRVRIFYKGMNRNRTFITEEFAKQLIDSLPYAPIKGIFDVEEIDYKDHGKRNSEGKIYGVVMENPNFAWEDHMDSDGVVRTYACADVLLFTALYPEAKLIPEKGQSMEIYQDTLVGQWKLDENGEPYYLFEKGCFIGLQVLGDDIEPCFEGAAFYSLCSDIQKLANYIKQVQEKEERKKMDKTLFRLSDSEKACALESLLNPNFNEEGGWKQDRVVLDVYDDYAVCYNFEEKQYERAYYSKDNDAVTLGDIVKVFIVDVTADEQMALEAIKTVSGTYEVAKASLEENATLKATIEEKDVALTAKETEYSTARAELEEKISTLEAAATEYEANKTESEEKITEYSTKIEALEAEKVEMEQKISDITSENESLTEFKKNVELEQKEAILGKYEEHLNEETYNQLKTDIDKYTVTDFKKEVCTAAVESSPTIFSKETEPKLFYSLGDVKDEDKASVSGVERILTKYKKNGGK